MATVVRTEPSVWQKFYMGAITGTMVGLTIGAIFGTFTTVTYGAGPRGFIGTLSRYMMTSGATFGFFMGIGSVIRTEDDVRYRVLLEQRLLRERVRARWAGARAARD